MLLTILTALVVSAVASVPAAYAAVVSLVATGITSPAGQVTMGGQLWVSDHGSGFCKVDPATQSIVIDTCIVGGRTGDPPGPVSPGQPTFDPATHSVYVPDNSTASKGVWRLKFNPTTKTVSNPVLLASSRAADGSLTSPLAAMKITSTALGPDGKLYVGSGLRRGDTIMRITTPSGRVVTQKVQNVAKTSDGGGVSGLAFAGPNLYLAEGAGVTRIANAPIRSGTTFVATAVAGIAAPAPQTIASGGKNVLYVADLASEATGASSVLRYTISTNTQDILATKADDGTPFAFATGLSVSPAGTLSIGDDPTQGNFAGQGHIYSIQNAATAAPEVAGAPGKPATPPPPAGTTTGALFASKITSPGGAIWLGTAANGRLWVSDHAQGFCSVDAAQKALDLATCNQDVGSPGQPSFDPATNFVYVPDNSSKSQGVWRLTFDPATGTVSDPVLLASADGVTSPLAGLRATASAVSPDGKLYIGFTRNGNIVRITNPGAADPASQAIEVVGRISAPRGGVSGLAFLGSDLYLAEGGGVTKIAGDKLTPQPGCETDLLTVCASASQAVPTSSSATAPTAIASDGTNLFVAETPVDASSVLRFNPATGTEDVYATSGTLADGTTTSGFKFATALALDEAGNLFVGDDPADGAAILQGRVFEVPKP